MDTKAVGCALDLYQRAIVQYKHLHFELEKKLYPCSLPCCSGADETSKLPVLRQLPNKVGQKSGHLSGYRSVVAQILT